MLINELLIGILIYLSCSISPVSQQIVTGDSLYSEGEIENALNLFSNIPVTTNDTNFNDIQRRIQYLQQLVNDQNWGGEVAKLDQLIKTGELDKAIELVDQIILDCPNREIKKICFYKKAEILKLQDNSEQAIKYYLFSDSPDNLLKAAQLAMDQDLELAKEILNQIIEKYPYTVEAYIAREYLIHD
ncbi:MAG: hypothetical protein APR63_06545 [Desulfuromonas sp. SDB]|nr:MAG: hypothetical protein APR63_06545 [Desulfuromonas sp. SDB]